jgi:DNA-binding CsgD family transcriptional regulator
VTPPRITLDAVADLASAAGELELGGWRVRRGFAVPDEPWDLVPARVVLAGDVDSEAAAQAALLAAVRGAGLAVRLDHRHPWASAFLADLARLDASADAPETHPGGTGAGVVAVPGGGAGPPGVAVRGAAAGPPGVAVPGGGAGRPAVAGLTPQQRELLDLLAGGASIAEAARRLYLSLRTANRRIAAARDALGVATTREAVLAHVRLRGG